MPGGANQDDVLWAAVADPTRRRVLDALLEQGEATTTTLAAGCPSPARPSPSISSCSTGPAWSRDGAWDEKCATPSGPSASMRPPRR